MASLGAAGVGMGMRMGMGSREEGIKGRRMNLATMATKKNAGGSAEEKGPFDWVLSGMQKDQLLETDPVLKKMDDDDNKTTGTTSRKVAVAANEAKKKFPGFGGLFSKK